MNLCEKSGVATNVYAGLMLFKKDADFRGVKKVFVLQETGAFCQRRCHGVFRREAEIFGTRRSVSRQANFSALCAVEPAR
jgi:hypothetical protein